MFQLAMLGNRPGSVPTAFAIGATSLVQPALQPEVQPQLQTQAAPTDTVMQESAPTVPIRHHHEVLLPSHSPSLPPSPPPQLEEDFLSHSPGSPRT